MDLRVVIVDDLESDRTRLATDIRALAERIPRLRVSITTYTSAEKYLEVFRRGEADLAFLDVCMGNMNGIELAQNLRNADPDLLIVFVTTSKEFALEAYPTHPFDYLIKPYEKPQLSRLLLDALRVLRTEEVAIDIRVPRDVKTIPLRAIVSAEARGHKTLLHLEDGTTLESIMSFSEIEQQLGGDPRFLLVNRGILVNLDYAVKPEGDTLIMEHGMQYPLRKRDRAQLASRISNYLLVRMGRGRRG